MQTNRPFAASGTLGANPPVATQQPVSQSQSVSTGPAPAGRASHVRPGTHSASSLARRWQLEAQQDPKTQDLALKLTASLRAKHVSQLHQRMVATGAEWQLDEGTLSTRQVSATNLRNLYRRLKNLAAPERQFLQRFYATPLHITHATNQPVLNKQGQVALYSRRKLAERRIDFPHTNTTVLDKNSVATDDHVFFSLEQGDNVSKTASRFGSMLYRFPFEQPAVEQQSLMHLFDPLVHQFPSAPTWLEGFDQLSADDQQQTLKNLRQHARSMNTLNSLFHGAQIKPGLALSIIERCRHLPQPLRNHLLENASINKLINGLYRPQILVPRHFYGQPSHIQPVRHGADVDYDVATLLEEMMNSGGAAPADDAAESTDLPLFALGDASGSASNLPAQPPAVEEPVVINPQWLHHPPPDLMETDLLAAGSAQTAGMFLNDASPDVLLNNINDLYGTHFTLPEPLAGQEGNDLIHTAWNDVPMADWDPGALSDADFERLLNNPLGTDVPPDDAGQLLSEMDEDAMWQAFTHEDGAVP